MNQDSWSRLVANLHHVGRRASILKRIHQILRIGINGIRHRIGVVRATPAFRNNLFARVRPNVAVMDIHEKSHARRLDFFGISNNMFLVTIRFGIVTATARRIAILSLGRYKRAQTNRIEPVIFQDGKDIAFLAINIKEFCITSFVFLDFRDISAVEEI